MKEMRTGLWTFVLTCMCMQVFVLDSWPASSEPSVSPLSPRRNLAFNHLPQRPVPEGRFSRWCGADGRFLMVKNERGGFADYWIQGHPEEEAILLPNMSRRGYFECDQTGTNLIVAGGGLITEESVKDQATRILATYRDKGRGTVAPVIAVSPDMKYAAFDSDSVQMEQGEQPSGMRLVSVAHSKYMRHGSLLWSEDSSLLFNFMVVQDDTKIHLEAVQIIDVDSGKDTTGNLPSGAWFEKGVFLRSRRKLLLFLRPSTNDIKPDPGSVYTCEISPSISCRVLISDVDEVSFGNDGKIGSVKEVLKDPKRRFDGDSVILPIAFVAEIRNPDSSLVVSERFARKAQQLGIHVVVSPSGKEAALIWDEWSQAAREVGRSGKIVTLGNRN
jgi:hypothetical protein